MVKNLLIGVCCSLTLSAFAQIENAKVTTPPVIDGNVEDWDSLAWLEDDDHHFKYNIAYDDNNVYIRMKTSDEMTQHKLSSYGLTVWLDPLGKKKTKLGLRFPTGVEAKERLDALRTSGELEKERSAPKREELRKELKKKLVTDIEVLELIGLSDKPLTSSRSGITNGIKVNIGMDAEEAYVYEAAIPFKSYRLAKKDIEILSIGFETGKFVPEQKKGADSNSAGGGMPGGGFGGGGMGGYGGGYGRMGGGMRSGGSYNSSPLMSPTKAWTKVKLN